MGHPPMASPPLGEGHWNHRHWDHRHSAVGTRTDLVAASLYPDDAAAGDAGGGVGQNETAGHRRTKDAGSGCSWISAMCRGKDGCWGHCAGTLD